MRNLDLAAVGLDGNRIVPVVIGGIGGQIQSEGVPGLSGLGHPEGKGHKSAILLNQLGGGNGNAAFAALRLQDHAGVGADQIPIGTQGLAILVGYKLQRPVILQYKPHAGKAPVILCIQGHLRRVARLCLHRLRIHQYKVGGASRGLPGKKSRQPQCACGSGQGSPCAPEPIQPGSDDPMMYHIVQPQFLGIPAPFAGIQPRFHAITLRQYRTKPACRLCAASADEFSVISHRNSLQYASIPASFLCNLTKNLLAHLPHNPCAVLP